MFPSFIFSRMEWNSWKTSNVSLNLEVSTVVEEEGKFEVEPTESVNKRFKLEIGLLITRPIVLC